MDTDKSKTILKSIKPNFHLNVSIEINRYLGNWPPQGTKHRFAYFIFTILMFIFISGHLILQEVLNLIMNSENVAKIISQTPLMMTNVVYIYKYFLVMLYQERIQKLLEITNGPIFSKNNVRYERIVTWYAWHGIFHLIAYLTLGELGVILWGCTPIPDYLVGKNHLPLDGWFPYDFIKSPVFEITWSQQIMAVMLCCMSNVSMDVLITGFMNVASCQFELLKWNISTIGDNKKQDEKYSPYLSKKFDDQIYKEICECIQHNNAIFDFVAEVQDMFGSVICMQLFVNCLIICLTTFKISQLTTYVAAELVGNISYTCCMMYQIFIFCWHGNELYLHNESFALEIYMSDWLKFSEGSKRALKIMMMRIYRPLVIKAGFLMTLSLSTFVAIIKMSYSLFAVLRSSANSS